MTLTEILDASGLAVLAAQGGWILLLYRRMGRLRAALEGAGAVVAQLDAASRRLDGASGGLVQTVRDGIAEVDSKITACRRLSQELGSASRQAEEVAARLDQALRQNRRLQTARAAAPPRELVEPLGLAERLSARPHRPAPPLAAPFGAPAPRLVEMLTEAPAAGEGPAAPGRLIEDSLGAPREDAAGFPPNLPLGLPLDLPLDLPLPPLPVACLEGAAPAGPALAALLRAGPGPDAPPAEPPPRTIRVKLD